MSKFVSYAWSMGTTSFRVKDLNQKIEIQLSLLEKLWSQLEEGATWDTDSQIKYYDIMKEEKFVKGEAAIKEKDARQKTSGLRDLGLISDERKITNIGKEIMDISKSSRFSSNNEFGIDADSYLYLKQLLKYTTKVNGVPTRPFINLIYMLSELDYLTVEEFKYLVPICISRSEVKEMTSNISRLRGLYDIDNFIISKILCMKNYQDVLTKFRYNVPVTKDIMVEIGLNRKSSKYDGKYLEIYQLLSEILFKKDISNSDKVSKYNSLKTAISELPSNVSKYWKHYFFSEYTNRKIEADYKEQFELLDINSCRSYIELKNRFFELLHLYKWKATLDDYYDLNKRYFALSDIIVFNGNKIQLDLLPKYFFKSRAENMINKDYDNADDYNYKINNNISLNAILGEDIDFQKTYDEINSDLGTALDSSTIGNFLISEKQKKFAALVKEKYTNDSLVHLLKLFEKRKDREIHEYVTDSATIPTIFEYIVAIAWYKISEEQGNILEYMNLTIDSNLNPKVHAAGGKADIVYKYLKTNDYNEHDLLIEVTLSESTGQRNMEMEPVTRHLGEHIKRTGNKDSYVVFVATDLNKALVMDFRNRKTYYYPVEEDQYIEGLKMIPITSELLRHLLKNGIKYKNLYKVFDESFKSSVPDPNWYTTEIYQKVKGL